MKLYQYWLHGLILEYDTNTKEKKWLDVFNIAQE
jgi:hypothetical protein